MREVIALRRSEPVFRRRDFLAGEAARSRSGLPDVVWFGCDGHEMQEESWARDDARALGVFLNGEEIPTHDRDGNPIEGHSFLLLFNAHHEPLRFVIPQGLGDSWTPVIASDHSAGHSEPLAPGDQLSLQDRSLVILRRD